jgi:hypothetical protein
MGSREEFFSAVKLIGEKKIKPVVDSVLNGLGEAEKGFQLLKEGGQFGKVGLTSLRSGCRPPFADPPDFLSFLPKRDFASQIAIQIATGEKSKM